MLPPNLRYLLKLKNYYRHQYQRSRLAFFYHLYQLFAQIFLIYLTRLRNSKWSSFLDSLHTRTPNSRKSHGISQNLRLPYLPYFTRECKYTTPHTKLSPSTTVRALPLSHPKYGHSSPHNNNPFCRQILPQYHSAQPPQQLTNVYEVKRKILSLKLQSAPGIDGITPLLVHHLSRKALTHQTQLFNHLLRLGHFPTTWKRAKVIPVPKPNKPGTDPNSYRSISLLSTLGKLFERVLAVRLTSFVNQKHLLPHTQFGFRKKNIPPFPNWLESQITFPTSIIFTSTQARFS